MPAISGGTLGDRRSKQELSFFYLELEAYKF